MNPYAQECTLPYYLPVSLQVTVRGQVRVIHFCTAPDSLGSVGSAVFASRYVVHGQLCYTSALLLSSDPGEFPPLPEGGASERLRHQGGQTQLDMPY